MDEVAIPTSGSQDAAVLEQFALAVQDLVIRLGYPGLFLMIVLESTMVPIPSLLVMPFAGYLASTGDFSLPVILVINSAGALTGSALSYWFGAAGGKPLLLRYGTYLFVRPKDLAKTEEFFQRHGGWTVFIARFLPVLRHVISIPAGIARMPLRRFLLQTFLGSAIWGGGLMVVGYVLGGRYKSVDSDSHAINLALNGLILVVLVAGAIIFMVRRRRARLRTAPADAVPPK